MDHELYLLRCFYYVAQAQGFSSAARIYRISQPSLSRAVKQAEETFGAKLLERSSKGVKLTSAGQKAFQEAQQIMEKLQSLKISVKEESREIRGSLTIGASDTLCNYVLPQVCERFQALFPQCSLEIFSGTSDAILRELGNRQIEIGLFFTRSSESKWVYRTLGETEFQVVTGVRRFPPSLDGLDYIGSRLVDYRGPSPALKMLESIGWKGRTRLQANSLETQKKVVLLGRGFTVLPSFMIRKELEKGELVSIRLPKPLKSPVFLCHLKQFKPGLAYERYLEELKQCLRGLL